MPPQLRPRTKTPARMEPEPSRSESVPAPAAAPWWHVPAFGFALAAVTYAVCPAEHERITPAVVFYYGWLTAISTGLGALPFLFLSKVEGIYLGIPNAVAAGMMLAASATLCYEGWSLTPDPDQVLSEPSRVALGAAAGVAFILATKRVLAEHEEIHLGQLGKLDSRKVLLIMAVMTLHSFSEGVGIGTAFGGKSGSALGKFISSSLAVHNVPEGLAVALVLAPRGVSTLYTIAWAIFSSLPQPVMAVPAFLFVEAFYPVLPIGLGFAGGAMAYVAVTELFFDALEHISKPSASAIVLAAGSMMMYMQYALK